MKYITHVSDENQKNKEKSVYFEEIINSFAEGFNMGRRVFYSFHFEQDSRRVAQIRNIGVIEGNKPVSSNGWEIVKRGGDRAIKQWINSNLKNRSCLIVLIGEHTSESKWVNYEIEMAIKKGMAIFGIFIHNLRDPLLRRKGFSGKSKKGQNPFDDIYLEDGAPLSSVITCYDPEPSDAYHDIAENIEQWVEDAIQETWEL